jgi:PPM family protein phosphatase
MSFISKLFRKTDSAGPSENRTAQPEAAAPDAREAQAAASAAQRDRAAQETPSEPATSAATTRAGRLVDTDPQMAHSSDVPVDDAWWEESTPLQESIAPTTDEPDSVDELASTAARAANGTQPLASESGTQPLQIDTIAAPIADQPDQIDDSEEGGTRPLTQADIPMLAVQRSQRGLAVAALRDIGRVRSVNQDSIFAMTTTLPRESGDVSMGLFIVADGMGGHHGGEIASRLAISTVAHYVLAELVVPALTDGATEALQPLIIAAVQEANRAIWEHAQTVGSDMGTTCTVALLLGRALYLGHVGDSRAYLATPTGLKLITNDHSTVGRLIQVGQLDPAEARDHPLRSQLYRTVGQQAEVIVDFSYQQIGDASHLLLASDGLWGMLDDEILFDVLEHTIWPHDACSELIARANLAGGEDNISAIVVSLPAQT